MSTSVCATLLAGPGRSCTATRAPGCWRRCIAALHSPRDILCKPRAHWGLPPARASSLPAAIGTLDANDGARDVLLSSTPDAVVVTPAWPTNQQPARPVVTRRLFTYMDPVRMHAISSTLFLAITMYEVGRILSCTFIGGAMPLPENAFVLPALWVVNLVKDYTGMVMALKHRKGVVRDIFATGAVLSTAACTYMMFFDMWYPSAHPVAAGSTGTLGAVAVLGVQLFVAALVPLLWKGLLVPLQDGPGILATRAEQRRRKLQHVQHAAAAVPATTCASTSGVSSAPLAHGDGPPPVAPAAGAAASASPPAPSPAGSTPPSALQQLATVPLVDILSYYIPMVVPRWMMLVGAFLTLGGQPMKDLLYVLYPNFREANYCWALMGLWAGSIGAFAVTLRDRRLISRTAEMVMVGAPFAGFLLLIAKSCAMCADGLDMLRFTLDPLFVAHLFAQAYGIVG